MYGLKWKTPLYIDQLNWNLLLIWPFHNVAWVLIRTLNVGEFVGSTLFQEVFPRDYDFPKSPKSKIIWFALVSSLPGKQSNRARLINSETWIKWFLCVLIFPLSLSAFRELKARECFPRTEVHKHSKPHSSKFLFFESNQKCLSTQAKRK